MNSKILLRYCFFSQSLSIFKKKSNFYTIFSVFSRFAGLNFFFINFLIYILFEIKKKKTKIVLKYKNHQKKKNFFFFLKTFFIAVDFKNCIIKKKMVQTKTLIYQKTTFFFYVFKKESLFSYDLITNESGNFRQFFFL